MSLPAARAVRSYAHTALGARPVSTSITNVGCGGRLLICAANERCDLHAGHKGDLCGSSAAGIAHIQHLAPGQGYVTLSGLSQGYRVIATGPCPVLAYQSLSGPAKFKPGCVPNCHL
jgi:hypothetical protein